MVMKESYDRIVLMKIMRKLIGHNAQDEKDNEQQGRQEIWRRRGCFTTNDEKILRSMGASSVSVSSDGVGGAIYSSRLGSLTISLP